LFTKARRKVPFLCSGHRWLLYSDAAGMTYYITTRQCNKRICNGPNLSIEISYERLSQVQEWFGICCAQWR